jgi:uncharacterized glyoxalase superfamily protein PhnB
MQPNRSMPRSSVVPVLVYPDVGEAVDWLCAVFGFVLRLRIGDHRAQLQFGDGDLVVAAERTDGTVQWRAPMPGELCASVMVRVPDVEAHHRLAALHGARVVESPADHPYGERQYSVEDLAGHRWTFSQTVADVDPQEWLESFPTGGTPR